jgi:hypothetical protein
VRTGRCVQLDGRSHHPILPQRPSAYIEPAGLGKSLPHFNRVARPPPLQPRREASLSTRYIRTSGGMPPPSRGARLSVFGPVDDEATSRDRAPVVASRFSCHWRHGAQVRNRRAPAGRGLTRLRRESPSRCPERRAQRASVLRFRATGRHGHGSRGRGKRAVASRPRRIGS